MILIPHSLTLIINKIANYRFHIKELYEYRPYEEESSLAWVDIELTMNGIFLIEIDRYFISNYQGEPASTLISNCFFYINSSECIIDETMLLILTSS